jgi:hypothetical protein
VDLTVQRFVETLSHADAGGVTEICVNLGGGWHQLVGYFENPKDGAGAIAKYDGKYNVYVTLNPVKRDLLGRVNNRLTRSKNRTSDGEVWRDSWFLFDIDPKRPAGISSADSELQAAIAVGTKIVDHLIGIGLSKESILTGISGNGVYVMVRLPDYEITTVRIGFKKRLLNYFADKFSNDLVDIDRAVYNPSRLVGALGTLKVKGDSVPGRPHRRSEIRSIRGANFDPSLSQHCEPFNLYALIDVLVPEVYSKQPIYVKATGNGQRLDIEKWMATYRVDVAQIKNWTGTDIQGQLYVLRTCPFNPLHTKKAFIIQVGNGTLVFGCHHSSCADKKWRDFRALFEPDRASTSRHEAANHEPNFADLRNESTAERAPSAAIRIVRMADVQAESVEWLWFPYIPLGKLTLIEGDPGLGKSWLSCALAAACASGRGLPRTDPREPRNVLLLSAEDGLSDTIRPRLDGMKADLSRIFALDGAVIFNDAGLLQVEAAIIEYAPALVIIDPLVAYLGATVDLHKANEVRAVMTNLARLAEKYASAILGVRHLTKGSKDRAIYRGIGSIDFTAACRSVLLVGSDPDDFNKRAIVQIKNNLAQLGNAVGYTIEEGKFSWTGTSNLTAERILATRSGGEERNAQSEAETFLIEALANGARASKELQKEARDAGIAERTLWRAKTALRVRAQLEGLPGQKGQKWLWSLPEASSDCIECADESAKEGSAWQTQANSQPKLLSDQNFVEPAKESLLGRLDGTVAATASDHGD